MPWRGQSLKHTMSNSKDRFQDNGYTNWLKCGQALKCVAEGLTSFCKDRVVEIHKQLLIELGCKTCTAGCEAKRIVRKRGPGGKKCWTLQCPHNVCNKWVGSIAKLTCSLEISWENSDISKWPTQPWQVGKIFMAFGQDPVNVDPTETDTIALMQLMLNCEKFAHHMNINKAKTVKDIGNKLFQSDQLSLTDRQLSDNIADMVMLLRDRPHVINEISAQEAVHDLNTIKNVDIEIMLQEELELLREAYDGRTSQSKKMFEMFIEEHEELCAEFGLKPVKHLKPAEEHVDHHDNDIDQPKTHDNEVREGTTSSTSHLASTGSTDNSTKGTTSSTSHLASTGSTNNSTKVTDERRQGTTSSTSHLASTGSTDNSTKGTTSSTSHLASTGSTDNSTKGTPGSTSHLASTGSKNKSTKVTDDRRKEFNNVNITFERLNAEVKHAQDKLRSLQQVEKEDNKGIVALYTTGGHQQSDPLRRLRQDLVRQLEELQQDDRWAMRLSDDNESTDEAFSLGDEVLTESSEENSARLQEGHGGWNDNMKKHLGQVGVVKCFFGSDILVQFSDGNWWLYNKKLLQRYNRDTETNERKSTELRRCDIVAIVQDKQNAMKEGNSGWASCMEEVLGQRGIVRNIDSDGDVHVECMNHKQWCFKRTSLERIEASDTTIDVGDFVFVVESSKKVKVLQDVDHGGWNDKMLENLGSAGTVLELLPNESARVLISGHPWVYNIKALQHVARSVLSPCKNVPDYDVMDELFDVAYTWSEQMQKGAAKGHGRSASKEVDEIDEEQRLNQVYGETVTTFISNQQHNQMAVDVTSLYAKRFSQSKPMLGGMDIPCFADNEATQGNHSHQPVMKYVDGKWCAFNSQLHDTADTVIKVGDFVLVIDSYATVKSLQDEDHGGWHERMQKTLGSTGTVVDILSNETARVFISERSWIYNINVLKIVDRLDGIPIQNNHSWHDMRVNSVTRRAFFKQQLHGASVQQLLDSCAEHGPTHEMLSVGVHVRVEADETRAIRLQKSVGGWNSNMKEYLGKTGTIHGTVRKLVIVKFADGKTWVFNKNLLRLCEEAKFKRFDTVRLTNDFKTMKTADEVLVGRSSRKTKVRDLRGIVRNIDSDGDVHVECMNHKQLRFKPSLLESIDTSDTPIEVGDFVFVIDSCEQVKDLQGPNHGGWNDTMQETLGSAGTVLELLPNEGVRVLISGHPWVYNIKALRHVARSELSPDMNDPDDDVLDALPGAAGRTDTVSKRKQEDVVKRYDVTPAEQSIVDASVMEDNLSNNEQLTFQSDLQLSFQDEDDHINRYDIVVINEEVEKVKEYQKGHGGWSQVMLPALSTRGLVTRADERDVATVEYRNHGKWIFNSRLLERVNTSDTAIEVGDFVVVIDSYTTVKHLQDEDHGGWHEKMQETLGSTGTVVAALENGTARVIISGHPWIYNTQALKHIDRLDVIPISNTATWHDMQTTNCQGPASHRQQLCDSSTEQDHNDTMFCVGVIVRVEADEGSAIRLQQKSGGWNSKMKEYLGQTGTIKVLANNHAIVQFSDDKRWAFNKTFLHLLEEVRQEPSIPAIPACAPKSVERFDVVRLMDDVETVQEVQQVRVGWDSNMTKVLGMKGIVNRTDADGDVFVEFINNDKYWINPALLEVIDTSMMTIEEVDFVLVIEAYTDPEGWQDVSREPTCSAGIVKRLLPGGRAIVHVTEYDMTYNISDLRFIASADEMLHAHQGRTE